MKAWFAAKESPAIRTLDVMSAAVFPSEENPFRPVLVIDESRIWMWSPRTMPVPSRPAPEQFRPLTVRLEVPGPEMEVPAYSQSPQGSVTVF